MKKILILISIMLLILTIFTNPIYAATSTTTIENWESYNVGVSSGTGTYGSWETTNGNAVIANTDRFPSGSKALYFDQTQNNIDDIVWYNISTSLGFIGEISLLFEMDYVSGGAANQESYIYFYNDSIPVIELRLYWDDEVDNEIDFDYRDGTGAWNTLYSLAFGSMSDKNMYWNLTAGTGNDMTYSLWIQGSGDVASDVSSTFSTNDWVTFDGIYFNMANVLNKMYYLWIDDIAITTGSPQTGAAECDFSGYDLFYTGSDNKYVRVPSDNKYLEIGLVDAPRNWKIAGFKIMVDEEQIDATSALSDYTLFINGNPQGTPSEMVRVIVNSEARYFIQWCGLDVTLNSEFFNAEIENSNPNGNYYWYPVVRYSPLANSLGYYHNLIAKFGNGINDGSYLTSGNMVYSPIYWVYYRPDTGNDNNIESFNETMLNYYSSLYGDFFIEFNHLIEPNYYDVGSYPELIVNVTDIYYGEQDGYIIHFKYSSNNDNETTYVYDFTFPNDTVSGYLTIQGNAFYKSGQYKMYIYNKTINGEIKNLIYISKPVSVVDKSSGIDTSNTGIDYDFSAIPIIYKVFISIFIIMLVTLSPYAFAVFLSKSGMSVKIPELLYVAFFFFGVVISIILGFLDIWVLFVILFGLIITLVILWIQRNGISGGE